ncbi:MAG: zinc ABC transporter substrate-binding protein [Bacteroidales bacterium]|nr:zinc ABC transporter substrate-binding protein [Bacteroidales bacterium]
MRKRDFMRIMAVLVTMLGVMIGCGERERKEDVVSVSILPVQYFIDRLTDNALEVNVMVPQGASHGTYSPSARQMQRLSDSGIYFRIGYLGYEQAFIRRLNELNPEMKEVNLSNHVELIRGMPVVHGDHVHEGGVDPHIWMSPAVMLSLLPVIKNALVEGYPEYQETVEANYPALYADVERSHLLMQEITQSISQKRFLIFHPALTYLARDYGMEQVSIEHEGKEPSPGQLSQLIREARAETIPIIFIQEEYDQRNAELVAAETGAELIQINPLAYDWLQEMNDLVEVFKQYLQ